MVAVVFEVQLAADVQPEGSAAVVLQDTLVEVQVVHNPVVPRACRVDVGHMNVGGTAMEVLRVADTVYRLVECLAAVSAVDAYGVSHMVAQGLEHLAAEVSQSEHHFYGRCVVDAQSLGCLTLYEFAQSEILAEQLIGVICVLFHNSFFF